MIHISWSRSNACRAATPADCEVSTILQESGAGEVVANGDAAGLVAAIGRYRSAPATAQAAGQAARQAFERDHEMRITCERIRTRVF